MSQSLRFELIQLELFEASLYLVMKAPESCHAWSFRAISRLATSLLGRHAGHDSELQGALCGGELDCPEMCLSSCTA